MSHFAQVSNHRAHVTRKKQRNHRWGNEWKKQNGRASKRKREYEESIKHNHNTSQFDNVIPFSVDQNEKQPLARPLATHTMRTATGKKLFQQHENKSNWRKSNPVRRIKCVHINKMHRSVAIFNSHFMLFVRGVWLFWDKNDPTSVFLFSHNPKWNFSKKKTFPGFSFEIVLCVRVINYSTATAFIEEKEKRQQNNKMKNNIVIGRQMDYHND